MEYIGLGPKPTPLFGKRGLDSTALRIALQTIDERSQVQTLTEQRQLQIGPTTAGRITLRDCDFPPSWHTELTVPTDDRGLPISKHPDI